MYFLLPLEKITGTYLEIMGANNLIWWFKFVFLEPISGINVKNKFVALLTC